MTAAVWNTAHVWLRTPYVPSLHATEESAETHDKVPSSFWPHVRATCCRLLRYDSTKESSALPD